jgi:hypothetical protein
VLPVTAAQAVDKRIEKRTVRAVDAPVAVVVS